MGCEYGEHSCPIDRGDVDHGRVLAILKNAGYTGGLYIEDESLTKATQPDRVRIIRRTAEYLGDIIAAL